MHFFFYILQLFPYSTNDYYLRTGLGITASLGEWARALGSCRYITAVFDRYRVRYQFEALFFIGPKKLQKNAKSRDSLHGGLTDVLEKKVGCQISAKSATSAPLVADPDVQ